ncbi:MAG: hypothetical protein ACM335_13110 [Deltaproteobacteria bacterium]
MTPITIQVVAPTFQSLEMGCPSCNLVFNTLGLNEKERRSCNEEYPEDWKEALGYLSRCISEISRLYRHRVRFEVIEAQSLLGLWIQIRHRVFRYPAFIVDGKKTYVGFDCEELVALINERIKEES